LKTLIIAIVICLILAACGVKAPPMPNDYEPPGAVKDLRHSVENRTVTLAWTVPQPSGSSAYPIVEARILRLRTPIGDTVCENCPLVFEEVRKLSVTQPGMVYSEPVGKGFQYRYKIVLYDEKDFAGGDSNIVQFEYPLP